ncbi:MAG: sulfotransferase domain-containing protein [Acidobacteriota bacterium]
MYIITGMHRSGTSIISQLVFHAGGDLGDFDKLYPGDRWNPDGYFEQVDILGVNISIVNGPWGKFSYFFLPGEELIMKRAKKFNNKIKNLSETHSNKIVKDPRFCLTFPAWTKYGSKIEKVVVNIREPIQVANSLKKRNHIPVSLGLNLWYEHNKRLLDYVNNKEYVLLNYHKLLDPAVNMKEFERVLEFFNIKIAGNKIESILREYVRPSMNHNRMVNYKYEGKIEELWNKLLTKYEKQ